MNNITNAIGNNIAKSKYKVSYELVLLLTIGQYINSMIFLAMGLCYLLFLVIVRNHQMIVLKTRTNVCILIFLMITGALSGLMWSSEYSIYLISRDIFYILNPIVFIMIGTYVCITSHQKYDLYKTLIILAATLASIHMINVILNINTVFSGDSGQIRSLLKASGITIVIGIVLLITSSKRNVTYFRKSVRNVLLIICMLSFILSFSRTNLVILVVMLSAFYLTHIRISMRSVKGAIAIIIPVIIVLALAYTIIPSDIITFYTNKLQNSFSELNTAHDWTEPEQIVYNWRGYEIYCAQIEFENGNVFEKVFGYGFGKGIDVGKYAYLVMESAKSEIPFLHNGYYTILIKNGLFGLAAYLLFYFRNILTAVNKIIMRQNIYDSQVLLGVIFALLIAAYFVSGIIYKGTMVEMCLLVGFVGNKLSAKPCPV